MRKFEVNDKVYLPKSGKYGTVKKVNDSGQPTEVEVGTKIITVVNEVVKAISIFRYIWLLIKGIFKK